MTRSGTPVRPVAVIIPTWNGLHLLEPCLTALRAQTLQPDLVLVVDNGSVDGTVESLTASHPDICVLELSTNHGFAGGCNAGMRQVPDHDVVLLNNDALPRADWLAELHAASRADSTAGLVTSKLLDYNGLVESTGDYLNTWAVPTHRGQGHADDGRYDAHNQVLSACAGAVLIRRELLQEIGDFDESFFAYYEDVDLSLRARLAGWEILFAPRAVVKHAGSATSNAVPGFRRFHTARNIWWLHTKSVPGPALAVVLLRTLLVQPKWILGAIKHQQLGVLFRAYAAAARGMPRVWRQRQAQQSTRRVEPGAFMSQVRSARRPT